MCGVVMCSVVMCSVVMCSVVMCGVYSLQGTLIQIVKEHVFHGDMTPNDVMLFYTTVSLGKGRGRGRGEGEGGKGSRCRPTLEHYTDYCGFQRAWMV